ncbi:hypothetical protein [Calothrix sp. CCY 0018]|uniref:hypothetical protein n=1 Tax=Calothrix sp. CCY 0018 TaxID=3103864 RepID=UPI0039C67535
MESWNGRRVEDFLELTPEEATLIEIRRSSLGQDKGKFVVPDDFNALSEEILLAFEGNEE